MKLLLVEDNAELAHWVVNLLRGEDFAIDCAPDGERADAIIRTQHYDAVLLDMRLPGISGKELLARVRRRGDTVPVMMLTAHGSVDDKVDCFSAGADDYVVKPFESRELVARIRALIRRQCGGGIPRLVCGDLVYVHATREFQRGDAPLALRRREHAILETLMMQQGRTVSKVRLMESVYDLEDEASPDAIDIYLHRLRKHLSGSLAQIVTLRGLGYILRPVDPAA